MKKLWIRLGCTIQITDIEEQAIIGADESNAEDMLRHIIAEGRFCPDGEAYIPTDVVWAFNKSYGTSYGECDLYFDL